MAKMKTQQSELKLEYQPEPKSKTKKELKSIVLCTLGALLYAFNLNSFVNTGGLYPGGFAGITILIQNIAEAFIGIELPYTFIYLPINLSIKKQISMGMIDSVFTNKRIKKLPQNFHDSFRFFFQLQLSSSSERLARRISIPTTSRTS